MSRHSHRLTIPLALALAAAALAGYQALAQRAQAPAAPIVATVQMEKLFDGLDQRADAKAEVAALEAQLTREQKSKADSIDALESELENVVDEQRREELTDQIALEKIKFKFWQQAANSELEVEKALRLQYLYTSIKEAIRQLAGDAGYDMVILDDSADELPFDRDTRVPAQMQVLQQITSRKILYLNGALDITEDLIIRMNNEFRAAQQVGP